MRVRKTWLWAFGIFFLDVMLMAQVTESGSSVSHYDGTDWNLKGDGVVCCPCKVPCPCRTNSPPSYGHCEATLYLRIKQGNYGAVSLDGMNVVNSGGMCSVSYQRLSALYFEPTASRSQQLAFMELLASFSPEHVAESSHVRIAPLHLEVAGEHLFRVVIAGALEMTVDRNWGQAAPPMPMVAAQDYFSNALQYAQNIRYRMSDTEAGLDFDYSRRQANYREIDLNVQQYRSKSMLIQFGNGNGGFSPEQIRLIRTLHLTMPELDQIQKTALQLRKATEARGKD
jgi:hypothetical protein